MMIQKEEEMAKGYYSALEVAGLLGISKQTLMRYEKGKIFPKPRRNPINNRREYTLEDVQRLKKVLKR